MHISEEDRPAPLRKTESASSARPEQTHEHAHTQIEPLHPPANCQFSHTGQQVSSTAAQSGNVLAKRARAGTKCSASTNPPATLGAAPASPACRGSYSRPDRWRARVITSAACNGRQLASSPTQKFATQQRASQNELCEQFAGIFCK